MLDTYFLFYLANGAHHLDLRPPNESDPADVKLCREFVLTTLKKWLREIKQEKIDRNILSE
jgi:hypothetical protein